MLTFLRKIRRSLIESGSARKYILYAIGEIALVVIGILIALQINNWNEWRKVRILENDVLLELLNTTESNCEQLDDLIRRLEGRNASTDKLISFTDSKEPYRDSMNYFFHSMRIATRISLNYSGYEALKNAGFDLLQNEKLKAQIVQLYEMIYPEMIKVFNDVKIYDVPFSDFLNRNFIAVARTSLRPLSYDRIRDDTYYYSMLHQIKNRRSFHLELVKGALEESQRVLQLTKDELGEDEIKN